jgi:hypothetical protein
MTLSKRSGVRLLLLGAAAIIFLWGLFPLVYFAAWPVTAVAWAVAAAIVWKAAIRK